MNSPQPTSVPSKVKTYSIIILYFVTYTAILFWCLQWLIKNCITDYYGFKPISPLLLLVISTLIIAAGIGIKYIIIKQNYYNELFATELTWIKAYTYSSYVVQRAEYATSDKNDIDNVKNKEDNTQINQSQENKDE